MEIERTNLTVASSEFRDLDEESKRYIEFHKYRYQYLLHILSEGLKGKNTRKQLKLLDIGPSFQTHLIRKYFPELVVDTLGFDHPTNRRREGEVHYQQDLNFTDEHWNNEIGGYEVIVFCEVIEHLYTQPEKCLQKLYNALSPGGLLIIQTPNAVAIHKRLKLLIGLNPYQLLQENRMGHFREYTVNELTTMMKNTQFDIKAVSLKNYFNNNSTLFHRAFVRLEYLIPKSFRDGITLIANKPVTQ